MARRALADLLLEEGLLDEAALRRARRHARLAGISLARAIVEERQLNEGALVEMLVRRLHVPRVDLAHERPDADALREVPHDFADARRLLPLSIDRASARRTIRVAMADPLDVDAVDEIEMTTGCELVPCIAGVLELAGAIQRHYRGMITKAIPRRPRFGEPEHLHTPAAPRIEPITQPAHRIADEVDVGLRLEALVELLAERGVVDKAAWQEAIRGLVKRQGGE